jgi:hypothetical protein
MRPVHWIFVVSVLLFVSGIAFTIAGAREARKAPATQQTLAANVVPVASVKQIMKTITGPTTDAIFNSVSTSITKNGVEEVAPHTDAEWEALGNQAAALIESGNLILLGNRAVDKGNWVKITQAMIDAATLALRATEAKSPAKILEAGEKLNETCDNCHLKYRRG